MTVLLCLLGYDAKALKSWYKAHNSNQVVFVFFKKIHFQNTKYIYQYIKK